MPEPAETDQQRAERVMAWAEYRNTYQLPSATLGIAHAAFMAGWEAHRDGNTTAHQQGPQR